MTEPTPALQIEKPEAPSRCRSGSRDDIRTGDLGSWPVIIALALVVLVFSQTAQNFFTPGNFTNIITQMAGTCLLAYGVVFVLLIGEIDLSVALRQRRRRRRRRRGAAAERRAPAVVRLRLPRARSRRRLIGAFQGSIVALVGVPSFVVTLAGFEIWQGVILRTVPGVIVIQDNTINNFSNYLFPKGWWAVGAGRLDARHRRQRRLRGRRCSAARLRHAARDPDPRPVAARAEGHHRAGDRASHGLDPEQGPRRSARAAASSSARCSSGRSSPSARPSAGTSTPSAATPRPRAAPGSTSPRIRILVFMIAGACPASAASCSPRA